MKKIKNFVLGGIENKIFNLILATAILISAAFIAVTLYQTRMLTNLTEETSQQQLDSISVITEDLMENVVSQSLDRTTGLEAMLCNELFHGFGTRVEMLQENVYKLFDHPFMYPRMEYAAPDPADNGQVVAQLILADDAPEIKGAFKDDLGLIANMSDMMISMYGANEATNSLFIALPSGAFLVVDDRSASKFEEDGTPTSYDPRTRPWYIQAVEKGGLIFTDVEVDAFTGDIGVVCAAPVYVDDELVAVVGSDLFLTSMQAGVQASDENGGFICIVNNLGHVVFSPKTEGSFAVRSSDSAVDLRKNENEDLANLVSDAMLAKTDVRRLIVGDEGYYMIGAPIGSIGWAIISVFSEDMAAKPVENLRTGFSEIQAGAVATYHEKSDASKRMIIILLLGALAVLCTSAIILGKRIVRPLNRITQRISEISEDNVEFKFEDAYKTGDEIEVLAQSFANISHRTVQYVEEVLRVTAEKERIGTELHMANQIQESMLPSIFPAFPDRPEFDIFASMEPAKEVGGDFYDFFLIDDDHLCMVMADVSGKGVPAALFMMASKIIVQNCAKMGQSASEILAKTNEALCSNNKMEMFVTIWIGILEISTGKVTAANAGHEFPVFKKASGKFEIFKDKHGFVVGGMDGVKYKEYTMQLNPGDKLFVYTDGLPEATDAKERMFGTERMVSTLNEDADRTPKEILKHVREGVQEFVQDAEQFDDLTMLCLEYKGNKKNI